MTFKPGNTLLLVMFLRQALTVKVRLPSVLGRLRRIAIVIGSGTSLAPVQVTDPVPTKHELDRASQRVVVRLVWVGGNDLRGLRRRWLEIIGAHHLPPHIGPRHRLVPCTTIGFYLPFCL